jgi:hypothetical protein
MLVDPSVYVAFKAKVLQITVAQSLSKAIGYIWFNGVTPIFFLISQNKVKIPKLSQLV